jgi:lysophospholipase L1-like esterase
MVHVVLLGDSIFDNARYVPGHLDVARQLAADLGSDGKVTLLAIDGNVTADVERQLTRLPNDATHLAVSVGGNDALRSSGLLVEPARTVAGAIDRLRQVLDQFREDYHSMLSAVGRANLPTVVCTIYDSIPGLEPAAVTALNGFNDVILRSAIERGLPVVDLRLTCREPSDYSELSPIEPSHLGGAKIAHTIARVIREHNFAEPRTAVHW